MPGSADEASPPPVPAARAGSTTPEPVPAVPTGSRDVPAVPAPPRPTALAPDLLVRRCDPATLQAATSADLPDLDEIVGQDRAIEAVAFAIGMRAPGYNLFAIGPEGTGRYTVVRQFLEREAASQPVPDDWCYVHNYDDPRRPRAIRLPPGRAVALRAAMKAVVSELSAALPALFEGEQYRSRRLALEEAFKQRRDAALGALESKALLHNVGLARTPLGFAVAPVRGGEILNPDQFAQLPPEEQQRLKTTMAEIEAELQALLATVPAWEREHRQQVRALNQELVKGVVVHVIADVRQAFADMAAVQGHLDAVEADLVESAETYIEATVRADEGPRPGADSQSPIFHRCEVNVVVDHGGETRAPVVYEDLPTQPNLLGRIEHIAHLGALLTDFTLIKAGALHRANGGYLVLDARRLLRQPFAWDELKRALRSGELRLDGVPEAMSWVTTVSIEPEPIPLDVKVVLVGDRLLFYLLAEADPEMGELFKVQADFGERIPRTPEDEGRYARLMATIGRREGLRPIDASAMARVIDRAARLAEDAERLSTNMRDLSDLVREADSIAGAEGADVVSGGHVQQAIEARRRRAGRIGEELREGIGRGQIRIETDGEAVGQANGLSVVLLGEGTFGFPTRITARVRLGRGDVVDIEREVELGGPIHSKGVLILSGFLGGRFGQRAPLALTASLVFEQSYGQVEGDSASMAELCALLSAIGEFPLSQSIAVTGSVDQRGRSQAVGGVNHKIEGFFDVCAARGLTGRQGVAIPRTNATSLMLREDVVEACRDGRFAVHVVDSIDEILELLTGQAAGELSADGQYPPGTLNGRIERRVGEMAEALRESPADDRLERQARPAKGRRA